MDGALFLIFPNTRRFKNKYLYRNFSLVMTNIVHLLRDFIFQRNHYLDPKYPYYFNVPSLSSYFKMFPEILLGNILKYDTVGNIYNLLGKCSFKYVDEHFISLIYAIIL